MASKNGWVYMRVQGGFNLHSRESLSVCLRVAKRQFIRGGVLIYEDRGALRGTPGSAYPHPEPNATGLPSSATRPPEVHRAAGLAGNSTTAHCPRRDEAPVPPLLPALAKMCAATAAMCAAAVTMPLAGNSKIAHCPRRDEAPVPPLLPALVALLLPTCALPL